MSFGSHLRKLLLCCAFSSFGLAFGDQIAASFNSGQPQAVNTYWAPITDIGWYYTPSTSYDLVGVDTIFTTTTNPSDIDRSVTVGIWTDRPSNGGTLLESASFNTATARGVYGGATFSGALLTAGTTYFVGLENILNLGVNQVSYSTSGGASGPPGSVALDSTWADSGGAGFGTEASNGTTWFDKPVMEFLEPSPVSGAPEPASLLLACIGLGAVAFLGKATCRLRG
jgi:hypothetical protein